MFIQTKHVLSVVAISAAFAVGFAGCGADLGACPSDAGASGQKQAGKDLVKAKCAVGGCHLSPNPANDFDFNSESVVKDNAAEMYSEAAAGDMPPTGALSDTELEALRVYLACTQ